MRLSDWQITWDPLGATPITLLAIGDLMDDDAARSVEQAVDIGRFDFGPTPGIASRGNARRRVEMSRRDEHATAAAAWDACLAALVAAPWGQKATLSITPRGGAAALHIAALLSSSHAPATDGGIIESTHRYALRIAPMSSTDVGAAISVTAGWYTDADPENPSIVIIVPPGEEAGLDPGDTVYVDGVPGVTPGWYPVRSTQAGSGSVGSSVTLATSQEAVDAASAANLKPDDAGSYSGDSADGSAVTVYVGSQVMLAGIGDGATYTLVLPSGSELAVGSVSGSSKLITFGNLSSGITYTRWYEYYAGSPTLDPLPIDGKNRANGQGHQCTQDGPPSFTMGLKRNGTLIANQTITPAWSVKKYYSAGGPANWSRNAAAAKFNLLGPGGQTVPPVTGDVFAPVSGGTMQKVTLPPA